jgi:hypothetical protein
MNMHVICAGKLEFVPPVMKLLDGGWEPEIPGTGDDELPPVRTSFY